jgi:hypothetical protein
VNIFLSSSAVRCSSSRLRVFGTLQAVAAKKLTEQIKLMEGLTKEIEERDYSEAELLEGQPPAEKHGSTHSPAASQVSNSWG